MYLASYGVWFLQFLKSTKSPTLNFGISLVTLVVHPLLVVNFLQLAGKPPLEFLERVGIYTYPPNMRKSQIFYFDC